MKFQEKDRCIKLTKQNLGIIYFLLDKGEVVYVGQSKVGVGRIAQHTDKHYDEAYFMPCPVYDLDVYEDGYIWEYMPKYNLQPNLKESCTYAQIRKALNSDYPNLHVTLQDISRAVKAVDAKTATFGSTIYLHGADIDYVYQYVATQCGAA